MRVAHQVARTRTPLIVALGAVLAVAGLVPAAPFPEVLAQSKGMSARACGEAVTLKTHDGTTTRYALADPREAPAGDPIALVLLVGGGGDLDLDDQGCPRAMKGNFLVRSLRHAADQCARTPPDLMRDITARTRGSRQQVVLVKGGPGIPAGSADVCEGRAPHGFVEQEAEVVAGIARFIRGGSY